MAGIRRGGSPEAWEKWGKSSTAPRGTQGWARLGLGMAGAAAPRRAAAGGGDLRRRRRSGGRERRQEGRGAPVEVKEASYGVVWARGRVEEGSPRRPRRGRRPWWRRRPFPGNRDNGARRSRSGRKERRMGTSRSSRDRSRRSRTREGARRSRPGRHGVAVAVSAAILVERAGDDDAWRGPAASGESRTGKDWGVARARPMADGLGVRPTQNREGEREERMTCGGHM